MIERLTKRNSNGDVASHVDPQKRYMLFVNRLAAYEDSGLSPEEVQKMARVKAEGRLMELPCKVGDTVYCITSPYNVTTDEEDFEKPKQVYETVVGSMTFYSNSSQIRLNHNGEFITHYFQLTDFGKTVFLTREEAEKALGGTEDEI
jgi:hypothetical protein